MTEVRQQVLHLWLAAAALDTNVVAWAFYDGAGGARPLPNAQDPTQPPYPNGVAALEDGWFLFQTPGPATVASSNGDIGHEFVFERRVVPVEV